MKTGYKNIILLLTGLGILILLFWKMGVDFSVIYAIKRPYYIALAVFSLLLAPLITAFRMKYFLLSVGKNSPLKEIVIIEYINKFLYYIAPFKLNVPAKGLLLNKMCDVKRSDSASVVTFEYGLDTGITLAIGVSGAILLFKDFPYGSVYKIVYLLFFIVVGVVMFFCIPLRFFEGFLRKAGGIRMQRLKKISEFFLSTMRAIKVTWVALAFNKKILWIMLATATMWILSVLMMEMLFLSLDYYVSLAWILVISCCGVFVGGITTIPGGLGVREATMVFLYSALGVPQGMSVVAVLLARLLTIAPIIVGYLASLRVGMKLL